MNSNSSTQKLFILKIIHWSILFSPIFLAIVISQMISGNASLIGDDQSMLIYLPALVLVLFIPLSNYIYALLLKSLKPEKQANLGGKIKIYTGIHLVRMVLIEFAGIVAVVFTFVTHTYLNLILLLTVIIIFYFRRPTIKSVSVALKLSNEEIEELKSR